MTEIEDFQNECARETEYHLKRRLIDNHKEVNKVCSRKKNHLWAFFLLFRNLACNGGAIWYYCTLCHFIEPITLWETTKGVVKYTKKNSSLRNHVLHRHPNEFNRSLEFLELRKTSQPDDSYELSTDDGSRNQRKANKVSVGGIFLYYLLPCHCWLYFSWTHGMSWSLRISRIFIGVKMWTPKHLSRI